MYSLRITGGSVYLNGQTVEADVLIDGERIAAIATGGNGIEAAETIDASGLTVLPGMIDTHCHTRDPGYTHKEDFYTASCAAAVGGVTTIIDMPNVEPPTTNVELFEAKRADAGSKSIVDFGHWVAATELDQIPRLAEAGATGFKIFQVKGVYPHDPRLAISEDGDMLRAFRAIEETGLTCIVHPFSQSLFDELSDEARKFGEDMNWRAFSRIYTVEQVWYSAVGRLLALQELSGIRLHLAHTHSSRSLAMVRQAKMDQLTVTAEIDPKYYSLTMADLERLHGLVAPAGFIHEDEARMKAIYAALCDGTLDNIGSDHAPHTLDEIAVQEHDAWVACAGSPQLDWIYSLLLNDVATGRIPLRRVVELLCEAPARIADLWPRKGQISPGCDADLVLVDMNRTETITEESLQTRVGWSPYVGRTVQGVITTTIRRGEVIARERKILAERGSGRYVSGGR
jgi:dihydroorotase (multifunctional complex type)